MSLWDIVNAFPLQMLLFSLDNLHRIERRCEVVRRDEHGGVPVPEEDLTYARTMLPILKSVCSQMSFVSSLRALDSVMASLGILFPEDEDPQLRGLPLRIDVSVFEAEIRHVRQEVDHELRERGYVLVAPDRLKYLMQEHPFGKSVASAFPKAKHDIQEASNCLAVEANTAAVFHLMRVAEHGLRALARDRGAKVASGVVLDLATWEALIKLIEDAETAIQSNPRTLAREAQLEFYHGAMMEFKRFKNVFRNRIMHTRDDYDRDQAHSAFGHVGAFMQILASRISERKKTPKVWKGKKWTTIKP